MNEGPDGLHIGGEQNILGPGDSGQPYFGAYKVESLPEECPEVR